MKESLRSALKPVVKKLQQFGIELTAILNCRYYPLYRRQRKEWLSKGGTITKNHMVLSGYSSKAGSTKGHYFHQDLLVASFVYENKPERHLDIGSRIDGFVAHVASFRKIEVMDILPLPQSEHRNIQFKQADLMRGQNQDIGKTDSLSCLHAIEHFGLGRYTDEIDVEGHVKGIENLVSLLKTGGCLYISFPIGLADEIHFNAHRVFHPQTIFSIPAISKEMKLVRFDYIDDKGDLHLNVAVEKAVRKVSFGCGIYTFEKNEP